MTRAVLLVTPKLWRDPALRGRRNLAIVMLRFGSKTPSTDARPRLNYKDIAEALGVSAALVRRVCLGSVTGQVRVPTAADSRKTLGSEHIKFLTRNSQLKKWAGKSLDERASLFTAKFPDKEISGGKLWHLFRKHGIKYKCVATKKVVDRDKRDQINEEVKVAFRKLQDARKSKTKVVYCDELMFTKHTNKTRDWSAKGHNTVVGESNYYTDYKVVAAAISAEVGVELVYISPRAIN